MVHIYTHLKELKSEKVSEHRGRSTVCSRVLVPTAPQPASGPDQHFCSQQILVCSLSSTKVLCRTRNELRTREATTVAPGALGYWTGPSTVRNLHFEVQCAEQDLRISNNQSKCLDSSADYHRATCPGCTGFAEIQFRCWEGQGHYPLKNY